MNLHVPALMTKPSCVPSLPCTYKYPAPVKGGPVLEGVADAVVAVAVPVTVVVAVAEVLGRYLTPVAGQSVSGANATAGTKVPVCIEPCTLK